MSIQRIAPVVVVALGAAIAAGLMLRKPTATRSEDKAPALLVETTLLEAADVVARVQGSGVVSPAQDVSVIAQVGGRVVRVSDHLVPGGRFRTGEALFQIDPRDYELGIEQQRSVVQEARVQLTLEQGRQAVAQREWDLLESDEAASPLALSQPQLEAARQALAAAESGLARAELDLERAELRAPFNAMVVDETVDVGQVVVPGTPLATLVGTDQFRVEVAIRVDQLAMLDLPDARGRGGASALVSQSLRDGGAIERAGRIVGLAGTLDPQTRMASVLVSVDDPLLPPSDSSSSLPLLPGAFVQVVLDGRTFSNSFSLPLEAVQEGRGVWIVDADDRLAWREVEVGWSDGEQTVVTGGLEAGQRVLLRPPPDPVEGQPVRVFGEDLG